MGFRVMSMFENLDPDHQKEFISSSLGQTQILCQILSKSVQMFLSYVGSKTLLPVTELAEVIIMKVHQSGNMVMNFFIYSSARVEYM